MRGSGGSVKKTKRIDWLWRICDNTETHSRMMAEMTVRKKKPETTPYVAWAARAALWVGLIGMGVGWHRKDSLLIVVTLLMVMGGIGLWAVYGNPAIEIRGVIGRMKSGWASFFAFFSRKK